jgi:hypothetical protein
MPSLHFADPLPSAGNKRAPLGRQSGQINGLARCDVLRQQHIELGDILHVEQALEMIASSLRTRCSVIGEPM